MLFFLFEQRIFLAVCYVSLRPAARHVTPFVTVRTKGLEIKKRGRHSLHGMERREYIHVPVEHIKIQEIAHQMFR